MDTAANETLNVKFLETDGDVTVSKENVNMTVIQFLEDTLYDAFEANDISVTKFLDGASVTETRQNNVNMTIIEFLESHIDGDFNDISVTKFLNDFAESDANEQNIVIVEFLDFALGKFLQ